MLPCVETYMLSKFADGAATVLMETVNERFACKWYAYHVIAFVSVGLLMCSHPLHNMEMYWSEDHGKISYVVFRYSTLILEHGPQSLISFREIHGIGSNPRQVLATRKDTPDVKVEVCTRFGQFYSGH